MVSLFSLFVVEMWMNNKIGGHSHGGALGFEAAHDHNATATTVETVPLPESRSPSSHSSFETDEMSIKKKTDPPTRLKEEIVVSEKEKWDVEGRPVDPLVYRKMNSK
jgi:hypothetical protein